jgi:hypothetical protein
LTPPWDNTCRDSHEEADDGWPKYLHPTQRHTYTVFGLVVAAAAVAAFCPWPFEDLRLRLAEPELEPEFEFVEHTALPRSCGSTWALLMCLARAELVGNPEPQPSHLHG